MFFVLSKILWFLASPVNLAIGGLVLASMLAFTRFSGPGRWLGLICVFVLGLLAFSPLPRIVVRPLEDRFPQQAWGLIRKTPGYTDETVIAASVAKTEAKLDILEAHLAGRAYVANERFGMGDIAVALGAHRWLHMPVQQKDWPNIRRWYAQVSARPAAAPAMPLPIA